MGRIAALVALGLMWVSVPASAYLFPEVDKTFNYYQAVIPVPGSSFNAHYSVSVHVYRPAGDLPTLSVTTTMTCWGSGVMGTPANGATSVNGNLTTNGVGPTFDWNSPGTLVRTSQRGPGVYSLLIGTSYRMPSEVSISVDLSEAIITDPESGDDGPSVGGGYSGLTDEDKSFWQQLLDVQSWFTLSSGKRAELDAMGERLRSVGPWGDVAALKTALSNGDALGVHTIQQTTSIALKRPKMHLEDPDTLGETYTVPLPVGNMTIGTGLWQDAGSPWHMTDASQHTMYMWRDVFRKFVLWASWGCFGVALLGWLKGKVHV